MHALPTLALLPALECSGKSSIQLLAEITVIQCFKSRDVAWTQAP